MLRSLLLLLLLLIFFSSGLIPRAACLFFLLLIPQALHSDCIVHKTYSDSDKTQIQIRTVIVIHKIEVVIRLTLGPAGPPRQRGVRSVPQSTQVLFVSPLLPPPPLPLQFSLSTSDNSPAESTFDFDSTDPSDIFKDGDRS